MERRPISLALKLLAGLMFLFLLAPVLIVVPMSFSGDAYMAFPPSSWGTRWYGAVFKDVRIADSFFVSLWLALAVTLLSNSASRAPDLNAARHPTSRRTRRNKESETMIGAQSARQRYA